MQPAPSCNPSWRAQDLLISFRSCTQSHSCHTILPIIGTCFQNILEHCCVLAAYDPNSLNSATLSAITPQQSHSFAMTVTPTLFSGRLLQVRLVYNRRHFQMGKLYHSYLGGSLANVAVLSSHLVMTRNTFGELLSHSQSYLQNECHLRSRVQRGPHYGNVAGLRSARLLSI